MKIKKICMYYILHPFFRWILFRVERIENEFKFKFLICFKKYDQNTFYSNWILINVSNKLI